MQETRSTFATGAIAGLLGAGAVALWFLIIDVVYDRLFYTPAALGSALFLRARSVEGVEMSAGVIAGYTIVHILAFIALGVVITAIIRRAEREPALLLGGVLVFVTLQVFVIGVIAILANWLLDRISWWTIVVANLIAVIVMAVYLWRANPTLRAQMRQESLQDPSLRGGNV